MRSQQLFEVPFISDEVNNNCSKGIRPGKCLCKCCRRSASNRSNPNTESQWLFESENEKAIAIIDEIKKGRRLTGSNLYFAGVEIQKRSTDPTLTKGVRAILKQISEKDIETGADQWASGIVNNEKKRIYQPEPGGRSGQNAGHNMVATIVRQKMEERILPNLVKRKIESILLKAPVKARAGNHPDRSGGRGTRSKSREFEFLFEVPFLVESPHPKYNNHSESDAMFGWAKQKWEQWRKSRANPSVSSFPSAVLDVSTLIRQLDHDPNPNRFLTREERDALTQVVTRLINRSILQKRQEILSPNSSLDRKQDLSNNLTRLVNLGRFRFLKQLPQLRNSLIQALNGTGVKFPY